VTTEYERAAQLRKAKDAALAYLGKAAATERRVRDKLVAKDFKPDVIDEAIEDLRAVGLLDDETYARDFAKRLAAKETAGARWIENKLRTRGIPGPLASRVAEEFAHEGTDAVRDAARQRLKKLGHVPDPAARQRRLANQLIRRGFPPSEAHEAARDAIQSDADPADSGL